MTEEAAFRLCDCGCNRFVPTLESEQWSLRISAKTRCSVTMFIHFATVKEYLVTPRERTDA